MNVLAAMLSLVAGLVLGAAIQRWGDRDRATHGHKQYPPEGYDDVQYAPFIHGVGTGWLP